MFDNEFDEKRQSSHSDDVHREYLLERKGVMLVVLSEDLEPEVEFAEGKLP